MDNFLWRGRAKGRHSWNRGLFVSRKSPLIFSKTMCSKIYNQQKLNRNKNEDWFYYSVGFLKFISILLNIIASTYSRIYIYIFSSVYRKNNLCT